MDQCWNLHMNLLAAFIDFQYPDGGGNEKGILKMQFRYCQIFCYDLIYLKVRFMIPLWHQKASPRADGVILWDYHVICVQKRKDSNLPHLVWDLDSSLPFPSPLATYVAETIRPSFQKTHERFCWKLDSPPPSYEVIVAEDGTAHNLNEYMEMSSADVVKSVGLDTIDAVQTQKLGVLVAALSFMPRQASCITVCQGMQRLMLQHDNMAKTVYTLSYIDDGEITDSGLSSTEEAAKGSSPEMWDPLEESDTGNLSMQMHKFQNLFPHRENSSNLCH
ncbi:UNVERIFIED_CONTAM: protein N-terminal glutamine amidohydrolase [Sesamum angustifolium]|uniref:Protein N-terminal glutamine amidohydrolase n=1 Tax=Sesamum angustifolium TaxID=2727405 RepID=A0AAW2PVP2_9LAMI